jgi:hypothetical protein
MAYAPKITHFYCWTCRVYEPKASPHYRTQRRRLNRRKAACARLAPKPPPVVMVAARAFLTQPAAALGG